MKKALLLLSVFLLNLFLYAAYIQSFPVTMTQPDGTTLTCYISGDEFYNWLHDENGYTIVQDAETGYLVYAKLENGSLKTTNLIAGKSNSKKAGMEPWLNISAGERMKLRKKKEEITPKRATREGYKAPDEVKNAGVMNNLVIYIHFADQEEFANDTTHYWEMFNSMETPETPSMRNFFMEMSYHQMDIASHFYPVPADNMILSYQDIYNRSYYMPYNAATNPQGYDPNDIWGWAEREQSLLIRALESIVDQIPASLDLDFNGDGYVDNICFIIKGDPTAWNTLLWPHKWTFFYDEYYIHGIPLGEYNLLLETHLDTYKASVISHETFHTLGAPDLYRYADNTIDPVGSWDIMCGNTNPPQSTAAYMKYKYGGWIDDIPEITEEGTYTIYPVWSDKETIYKIASPSSSEEYFTVEFRTKDIYWDSALPGSGLLIYRINPSLDGNADGPPDEVYVFRSGGRKPTQNGTIRSAHFSENARRTAFHNDSNPPCFLSDGSSGNIHIRNISEIGDFMTFEVVFRAIADFKTNKKTISPGESIDFTDLSVLAESWEWTFEGGTPSTSTEQHPKRIRYDQAGVYPVSLKVTNNRGEDIKIVEDCITVGSVSIEEGEDAAVTIYPNPSLSGKFNIITREILFGGNMEVYDMAGNLIITKIINDSREEIDLSEYASGVYIISVRNGNAVRQLKLIKQ